MTSNEQMKRTACLLNIHDRIFIHEQNINNLSNYFIQLLCSHKLMLFFLICFYPNETIKTCFKQQEHLNWFLILHKETLRQGEQYKYTTVCKGGKPIKLVSQFQTKKFNQRKPIISTF